MIVLGYGLRLPASWLRLCSSTVNMSMFAIEMKYIATGKLELSAGASDDIGPVEMELIFSIGFFLLGFLGTEGITKSITEHFSFLPSSLSWIKLN